MFLTVQAVLDQNQSLWQSLVAFVAAYGKFKTSVQTINSLSQSLNGGTKGVTANKRLVRANMAEAAEAVAGAVGAFASATDNVELQDKVNYSANDIMRVRDTESPNIAQAIHDAANANIESLATFGVTAETLADLQSKINAYTGNVSAPRTTRSNNRAAGTMVETEFDAADKVLTEQLDGLMVAKFKKSQPSFYAAYAAAREIVDNPGGRPAKTVPQPMPNPN
jgi:hypothetical protein